MADAMMTARDGAGAATDSRDETATATEASAQLRATAAGPDDAASFWFAFGAGLEAQVEAALERELDRPRLDSPEAMDDALTSDPAATVLAVYNAPVLALAGTMAEGAAPSEAAAAWAAEARRLIALLRRHRGRIALVDAVDLFHTEAAFETIVGRPMTQSAPVSAAQDAVLMLAASYQIATDTQLHRLSGELDAFTRRVGATTEPVDADAAVTRHRDVVDTLAEAVHRVEAVEHQTEDLLETARKDAALRIEEAETTAARRIEAAEKEAARQVEASKNEAARVAGDVAALQAQVEQLMEALQENCAALEAAEAALARGEAAARDAELARTQAENRNAALQDEAERLRKALTSTGAEARQAETRLEEAAKERRRLERALASERDLHARTIKEQKADKDALVSTKGALDGARAENARLAAEVARLAGELEDAQGQVGALLNSTSWRATAPARQLVQTLKR